ncbi:hypothetical protein [Paenibacillus donghaensis]|uniref:hypothetical protein n=1 Tax=Paenibacillus donghaensis TaxID=414771 RepID=UPI001B806FAF|nr:hypothetical protein [Paenibacillus donghaensis]
MNDLIQELKKTLKAATSGPSWVVDELFKPLTEAKSIDEWHEDIGPVLWWTFPIEEPPYCGSPLDVDWPGYHTHWTPLIIPAAPAPKEVELWDTVNHPEYGRGGVMEIIGTKVRVSFDDLDYHLTLDISDLSKVEEGDNQWANGTN